MLKMFAEYLTCGSGPSVKRMPPCDDTNEVLKHQTRLWFSIEDGLYVHAATEHMRSRSDPGDLLYATDTEKVRCAPHLFGSSIGTSAN